MAKQLIESLSTDFDPDKYRDEYREELLALIERKARGRGGRRGRLRGAEADQGARPDGGARGEPRRGQGRAAAAGSKRDGAKRDGAKRAQARRPPPSPAPAPRAEDQIEIAKQGQSREVDVDGHRLELTNLDKVLWPESRLHQGRGDRLLRADRRRDPPPPRATGR